MRKCFFCGEDNEIVLREFHIVPKNLGIESDETIVVCANCYKKLRYIYKILFKYIEEEEYREEVEEIMENKRIGIVERVKNVIDEYYMKNKKPIHRSKIIEELSKEGYDKDRIDKTIDELEAEGYIYQPTPYRYLVTKLPHQRW